MGSTDNFNVLSKLCTWAMESISTYKATERGNDRLYALEQVRKLARALEEPADTVYNLALSVSQSTSYLILAANIDIAYYLDGCENSA